MFKNLKHLTPAETEKEILKFWQENKIFEKSFRQAQGKPLKTFVFFDGPPFANGLPHYGHILASIIKDVIPRYQTMKGKIVPRRWGWDCHGLPVEYEIEKELGLKSKKDIEKFGIDKFNEASRNSVLRYADYWRKIIPLIGRWVDMERDYKTMDWTYTESVWWVFKTLFDKGLIYEGYKSMHLCPRCETTLSNFEVSQGYKDITDISIIAKFEFIDEPNTYILAWTTTPWTLPGNVALAVNENIKYQVISIKGENNKYIIAKDRIGDVFKDKEYKTEKEIKGRELIGKEYKPLFNYYYNDKNLKNRENGWKIYAGNFVTTEEGTGIVHIAPAFGEDDMKLAQKYDLPFIQHISIDGKFKPEVKDFVGLEVKPKEDNQKTDVEIIKWLAKENKLFKKEKLVHSYPHCWRCYTPLLNYASSSWFVKVTAIKNKLIANNKKINWIPAHIKSGRFGKWLEDARDWAISRSRFWGAPLPVWKCEKCKEIKVIGSVDEIKEINGLNKLFLVRHGEAENNAAGILNSNLKENHYHLTANGKKQIRKLVSTLKKEKIDMIFSSPFLRTKETTEIIAKELRQEIIFDERIREFEVGKFSGKRLKEFNAVFPNWPNEPEDKRLEFNVETEKEVKKRLDSFFNEINKKYKNKNIVIVSHGDIIQFLYSITQDKDRVETYHHWYPEKGSAKVVYSKPIDLHRPYIDEIKFNCSCGRKMERVPEVFDCWFESGSMPYGQAHYPFENKKEFEKNFPAEFIAEGLDQTRGWFYTLLVLSTALFNKPAYKNVIVNGIILTEDGTKMSKRLKNYPDPMDLINKYGADALRLYLLSSPAVRAEDLNFSERGVDEVYKKNILRLWNVYSFYDLYSEKKLKTKKQNLKPKNILDQWILIRLKELISDISNNLDKYELDKAARPIADFIDDLSTWYIRRSRVRFKVPFSAHKHEKNDFSDRDSAIKTTRLVLIEFCKAIAPFMPFVAEAIYNLIDEGGESVHLQAYPRIKALTKSEKEILEKMELVRDIVEKALALRQKAGIKVRQPLALLKLNAIHYTLKAEFLDLIKDEINVKEIIFDKNIKDELELDTTITAELKAKGQIRELIRIIQDLRKEAEFTPKDAAIFYVKTDDYLQNLISKNIASIKSETSCAKIEFLKTDKFNAEIETKIDDSKIWLGIKKI